MQQRSIIEEKNHSMSKSNQLQKPRDDHDKVLVARFALGDKKSNRCALEDTNCLFLVSIGKDNFEKDALLAQLSLINLTFSSCLILAADTLQSHNFISESILINNQEISTERSQELAKERGTQWLNNYKNLIDVNLKNIRHKISVWDDWKKDPDFDSYMTRVLFEIEHNSEFAHALEKSIQEYTARLLKRKECSNIEQQLKENMRKIENNCRSYLIEECAILYMISGKLNYQYIVYPGKATDILAACHKYLIAPQYTEEKMQWLTVRLEKKLVHDSKPFYQYKSKTNLFKNNPNNLDVSVKNALNKFNTIIEPLSIEQRKLFFTMLNSQFSEHSMFNPSSAIKRNIHV